LRAGYLKFSEVCVQRGCRHAKHDVFVKEIKGSTPHLEAAAGANMASQHAAACRFAGFEPHGGLFGVGGRRPKPVPILDAAAAAEALACADPPRAALLWLDEGRRSLFVSLRCALRMRCLRYMHTCFALDLAHARHNQQSSQIFNCNVDNIQGPVRRHRNAPAAGGVH
jgi:hypothetical protein